MFSVPIIPPDLRHEETIIRAAYSLNCLEKTIQVIFDRIDERIERNNVKVNELNHRIELAYNKVRDLSQTSKAIQIYSPAKFPATKVFTEIPSTFHSDDMLKKKAELQKEFQQLREQLEEEHPIEEKKIDPETLNLNDKLLFYHVRSKGIIDSTTVTAEDRLQMEHTNDLGAMPNNLRSTISLLQFNTNIQVYDNELENETKTDTWKRAKLFKNKRRQSAANGAIPKLPSALEPAPQSLLNRHHARWTPAGSLRYTPKSETAPELDVPLDLPDLPGIADDVRYEVQKTNEIIGPSAALRLDDLPDLPELIDADEAKQPKTGNEVLPQTEPPQQQPVRKPPSPPPLPPLPPPPLPPPPPIQAAAKHIHTNHTKDSRAELMEAIRNAGGVFKARLRQTITPNDKSTIEANVERPSNDNLKLTTQQKTATGGQQQQQQNLRGDLMADLHNKLLMRRKGISGAKANINVPDLPNIEQKPTVSEENTVISRISALIPPPNVKSTSDDDDGNDSNDTDWTD